MPLITLGTVIARTARQLVEDGAIRLAAGIAFYSVLSLAPLLLLVTWVAGGLWHVEPVRDEIVRQVDDLMGQAGAHVVRDVMDQALPTDGDSAAWFGMGMLLFGATTVFAQLQYSLNRVWNVQVRRGAQMWHVIRVRLVSLGLILGAGVILLGSFVASSAMKLHVPRLVLFGMPRVSQLANLVVSFVVLTLVFATIFKVLPDVKIAWRDVWVGATLTSVLFGIGKELIGSYLARSLLASAYGAAGSLVVLLLWVYFDSILLLAGAEFTQVFARMRGRSIEPKAHAESVGTTS